MCSGWGCPHEIDGRCAKVQDLPCDPGMKGCELYGRYRFANAEKNSRWLEKQLRQANAGAEEASADGAKQ